MDAWPLWNYKEGEMIRVVCYTNTAKSRLLLNGKQVGEIKNYDDNTGIIYWDMAYQEGKLEVVGLDKDEKTICNYALQSSMHPYALTAQADLSSIPRIRGLAHVVVQVVDEKGVPVMISDNEITCTIDGPAKLLGLEASNNSDMGDYTDNLQRAYHGRLLAYIQSTGKSGKVNLTFSSPWLKETKVTISIKD